MSDESNIRLRDVRRVSLSGFSLLADPRLNKGTAFSDEERDAFELHGLLPPHVGTLDEQVTRRLQALRHLQDDFEKYSFLRDLQDTNETLFYALVTRNIEEMLPLVYTPTVGDGCQRFHEIWRKPRGLFLSYPNRERIDAIFANPYYDNIRCIVVSDGERILGLGDQGAGGMGIPIGKMALYTALGGIHPEHCLPMLLDVGTDNESRLASPLYLGWRNRRIRGEAYDAFVDSFVSSVKRRWPDVLLQWEDFAGTNAARLLAKYQDQLCSFNDDIQGTAAVAAATLLSAINVTHTPLEQQTIAIVGFGTAGIGIANLLVSLMQKRGLSEREARSRFHVLDQHGLVVEHGRDVRPEQLPFARTAAESSGLLRDENGDISLLEVMRRAKPTVLIGTSGQPGAFHEDAIREMAKHTARPIVFPLSNPTSRCEATPQDLLAWTEGRALIGTGSPFGTAHYAGRTVHVDQTNNSYVFPGLALGIIASKARRVTSPMIVAAAERLAELSPTRAGEGAPLLPPMRTARALSREIAFAVGKEAIREGLAGVPDEAALDRGITENVWEPKYVRYVPSN